MKFVETCNETNNNNNILCNSSICENHSSDSINMNMSLLIMIVAWLNCINILKVPWFVLKANSCLLKVEFEFICQTWSDNCRNSVNKHGNILVHDNAQMSLHQFFENKKISLILIKLCKCFENLFILENQNQDCFSSALWIAPAFMLFSMKVSCCANHTQHRNCSTARKHA